MCKSHFISYHVQKTNNPLRSADETKSYEFILKLIAVTSKRNHRRVGRGLTTHESGYDAQDGYSKGMPWIQKGKDFTYKIGVLDMI